jgi:uncharacterized OB-fold protein
VTKDPSPDGKFAMLLTRVGEGTASLELIEVSSRRVVLKLTAETISNPSADDEWETNLGFVRCTETINVTFDAQDKPSLRAMTRKVSRQTQP